MKKSLVVLAMALVLSVATYVYAVGPGSGPGPGPGPCEDCGGCGKGASLTEEQRTQFHGLRQKFHDETATLREQIWAKRQELRALWSDSASDSGNILKKENELRDLQDQMRDKALQLKLEARKLLTPEQLSEFGERGMGSGFGGGHGKGHGMGHGMRHGMGRGMGPCPGPCN